MAVFAVAFLTCAVTCWYMLMRLERRDTAVALRRLGGKSSPRHEARRNVRPLLMHTANEVRGRMASTVLNGLRLKQAAESILEKAALKWGAAGLVHRSVAAFLVAFAGVTLWTGNRFALLAVGVGAVAGCAPLAYVRRAAGIRVRAFEEQFPDCLEFISRSMRAGHAFSVALEMVHREFSDPLAA